MNMTFPLLILAACGFVLLFHPFGLQTANWGEPITATDLCLVVLALISIIMLEVRYAARWIVKQIRAK